MHTEGDYARLLSNTLARYPFMLQRIESGNTGRGIPDNFYASQLNQGWIEVKKTSAVNGCAIVPWRPGQREWAMDYLKTMTIRANYFLLLIVDNEFMLFHNNDATWTAYMGLNNIVHFRRSYGCIRMPISSVPVHGKMIYAMLNSPLQAIKRLRA